MTALRRFVSLVDALNERIGRGLAYVVWMTAIICAVVVVLRYAFHRSFTWMQELYTWTHAVVFLLGISFAILRDAHVRVDILSSKWTVKTRAVVECIGVLVFTLPWMVVLGWLTWPFVRASWAIQEGAAQPNGMPAVFILKTFLLVFCVFVSLQALAILARALLVLAGDEEAARSRPFGAAAAE